ncbi:MAG TPA: ABC transporter substrate-binding protein [Verrucomicrobiae bacterium]
MQLKWKHQFQFAGYYAALEQGYYQDAGLDVELREAQPGRDPVETVLNGEAEFGVGTSELMLLRAKGKPVVVLAAIYQHSPLVLVARRTAAINDLHDLVGKPIMIEPQSAELFAYFKAEGVDPRNLKIEHHTFEVEDIIKGKVAAMSAYSTDEPFVIEKAGMEAMTFTPRSGGIDFYGDNLFTTEAVIAQYPERVKAFRAASLKGWEYALKHPREIVEIIGSKYGNRKTSEHLLYEAEHTKQLMHTDLVEVGHMNPGRWRHIADTYAEFGMIPRGFEFEGFMYDPNPQPNLRWVYWVIVGAIAVTLTAIGWMLPLYRLNRSLRHEISERLKAEENLRAAKEAAEEANAAKGHYMAVMAHEVRTPLAGMVMLMQNLGLDKVDRSCRDDLKLVENSAESLLKLVGDTLEHSKLEAGRLELEQLPVGPRELMEEVGHLFRPSAQMKALELRIVLDEKLPGVVLSDPGRLRQILNNLVSNAIKFTHKGHVELRAEMQSLPDSAPQNGLRKQKLIFRVTDTGDGIAPENQRKIFSPYAQADPTIARKHGGSGLGLSISKQLAKLLGGDITFQSTPGKGSIFTVEVIVEAA